MFPHRPAQENPTNHHTTLENDKESKTRTITQQFSFMELFTAPDDGTPAEISIKILLDEEPDANNNIPPRDESAEHGSHIRPSTPPIAEICLSTNERSLMSSTKCLKKHRFHQYCGKTSKCHSTERTSLEVFRTHDR
uniref:Uncharacterized protein n=1 Tax=Caenorhabditis japonica TaxID=281687 RepID=A0A8R1ISX7_CAEJA